jgi:hypothetical protein
MSRLSRLSRKSTKETMMSADLPEIKGTAFCIPSREDAPAIREAFRAAGLQPPPEGMEVWGVLHVMGTPALKESYTRLVAELLCRGMLMAPDERSAE